MTRFCVPITGGSAALYLLAPVLFLIGSFGPAGSESGPRPGVFLIPLGQPRVRFLDLAPQPLWPRLAALAPLINPLARPGPGSAQVALLRLGARIATGILLLAPGLATSARAEVLPRIEPVSPCFVDPAGADLPGATFTCGQLVVAEDRARPDGREVRLGFMRVSSGAAPGAPPLVMIAGGPGDSLLQPSMFYLFSDSFLGPLLARRDIIVLEQRGAKFSVPHLDCLEVAAFGWTAVEQGLDPQAGEDLRRQAIPVCARRAAANGIDLAQYNVLSIVADIGDARTAMGLDRIAFYGASYGSQVGQQLLRDQPQILEAAVLDGANALSVTSWVQDRARNTDEALDRLDALCRSDPGCAAAYDIRALLDRAMGLFDAGPILSSLPDPVDPTRSLEFQVTAEDFAGLVFEFQTGQTEVRALPAFLSELVADGRTSMAATLGTIFAEQLLAARNPGPQQTAALAHAAVVCSDDPVATGATPVLPAATSAYAGAFARAVARQYKDFCDGVGVPLLPPLADVDATSNVPVLILAGALDARTPLFRSREVAEKLPKSTLAIFPEGTHVQLGEVNACAAAIMRAFLDDPGATPDLGCIALMPRRGFVLPDGRNSVE